MKKHLLYVRLVREYLFLILVAVKLLVILVKYLGPALNWDRHAKLQS
ncbi:hypothetical protein RA2_03089 [Roseovarius sp. A-2]|nr:hypothetical protein RA2_03089 [Roseovarius sp. A-2]